MLVFFLSYNGCTRNDTPAETDDPIQMRDSSVDIDVNNDAMVMVEEASTPDKDGAVIHRQDSDITDSEFSDGDTTNSEKPDSRESEDSKIAPDIDIIADAETESNRCEVNLKTEFRATKKYPSPCTEKSYQTPSEEANTLIYIYNELDILISEITCRYGQLIKELQYIYNENGKLMKKQHECNHITTCFPSHTTYEYDETGKLVTEVIFSSSPYGGRQSTITYAYNQLDKIERVYMEHTSGGRGGTTVSTIENTVYKYNELGDKIEENSEQNVYYSPTPMATWPPQENMKSEMRTYERTYTYNESGNMLTYTQEVTTYLAITLWEPSTSEENTDFVYDEFGNRLNSKTEYSNGNTENTNYVYDEFGNLLVSKTEYSNGNNPFTTTYTYECWEM